jgi:inosose dehydratase
MSSKLRLATGPVTWGVDFADTPGNPPWSVVLDDIERSGIGALELGPVGYLPEAPDALRDALASRSLTAVGSYVFENLHDPAEADEILAVTERACRMIAAGGGAVLVVIDRPDERRAATAGRQQDARRLDDREWRAMLDTIQRVAAIARRFDLRPVYHPHAGGYVEFLDEIERLVSDTAGTDIGLCLDTGHLTYGRTDPVTALRTFADRVGHVHFKDIRGDVLNRVDTEALDFWSAIAAGIFCPIGEGIVDMGAVLDALDDIGYDGYATIEQDRVPGSGAPLDDLRRSMAVLAELQQR